MALRGVGRVARNALVVVGGLTVGAGVLGYAALHSQPSLRGFRAGPANLPKEFLLELDFEDLDLVEKSSPLNAVNQALGRSRGQVEVRQVVNALREGADDSRVKGVLALIGGTQQFTGLAQVQEIRAAMQKFRAKSSAPTIAYSDAFGEGGSNDTVSYYMASSFGKVYMMPSGLLSTTGLATGSIFLRNLLDRFHVEPLFYARGKYKNVVNMFTESGFTPEHREATEGILKGFTSQMIQDIAQDRGLAPKQVRAAIDASPLKCPEAISRGLIDRGLYRDQVINSLARQEAPKDPAPNSAGINPSAEAKAEAVTLHHLPRVGVKRYIMHQERQKGKLAKKARAGPQVAVVMACGSIVKGKGSVGGVSNAQEVASVPMCKLLGDARNDDNVKAVVLRIDSPGGSAVASDAICREVRKLRESGKPVVVSMGNIAASGGYYIAAPATKILAEPGTITGSIGVVFGKFNVGSLLRDYGIQPEVIAEGTNADSVSPYSSFSKEQERHLDSIVDWVYDGFLDIVSTHRKLPREEVLKVAQGRIWTGADALSRGLVDKLGGLEEAISIAKAEAGFSAEEAERVRVEDYPRPQSLAQTLMENWKTMQATSGSSPSSALLLLAAALGMQSSGSPGADLLLQAVKGSPGSEQLLEGLQQAASTSAGPQMYADFSLRSR